MLNLKLYLIPLFLLMAILLGMYLYPVYMESVIYSCEEDSDCKAVGWCCGCTSYGINKVVNKDYLDYFEVKRTNECGEKLYCLAAMSNHWTCFAETKCIDNRCVLERVEGKGGDKP